jgi:hypothetical protein
MVILLIVYSVLAIFFTGLTYIVFNEDWYWYSKPFIIRLIASIIIGILWLPFIFVRMFNS